MKFPVNYLVLEGVDLSGKTSLYNDIHKKSGYKWNIQDRSFLSMLIYAKLYNRNTSLYSKQLRTELSHLNNVMIWCHPSFGTIKERYKKRGDEIQNIVSLEKLYDLFEDHDYLKKLPNVWMINTEHHPELISDSIIKWLGDEKKKLIDISDLIQQYISNIPVSDPLDIRSYDETISFNMIDDNEEIDISIFEDEEEGEYYSDITNQIADKIESELLGKNEYNEKQTIFSRRFIYTSNTCISLFHVLYRQGIFHVFCTLRSSNVQKTLNKDLNFIVFLARQVKKRLEISDDKETWFDIKIHSGHLVR